MTNKVVDVIVPGDKSISHRALILGALATGTSTLRGLLDSADVRSTVGVLRGLGVRVPPFGSTISMVGVGLSGMREPRGVLDCGNSGTTARLLMGVGAAHSFKTRFDGDASLRSRPMRRVTQPLTQMGASVLELGAADRLPLEVAGGSLQPIDYVSQKASAQVKSAILLAGLCARVAVRVGEPIQSRDHTERLLIAMGAPLRTVVDHGVCVEIDAVEELVALDLEVPADFSSAAFFLARGLLEGPATRITNVGVNATRTGMFDVIRRMQGAVHVQDRRESEREPIATLIAEPCRLRGVQVEAAEVPHLVDEVPIIAALAARAEGETRINGAGELRVKETDRLGSMAANLRAVGIEAEDNGDTLTIVGSDKALHGRVTTGGDHRVAMAFGILGSLKGNDIVIDDASCVDVSFPGFWQQLRRICDDHRD